MVGTLTTLDDIPDPLEHHLDCLVLEPQNYLQLRKQYGSNTDDNCDFLVSSLLVRPSSTLHESSRESHRESLLYR
jgi:hypothetical protein